MKSTSNDLKRQLRILDLLRELTESGFALQEALRVTSKSVPTFNIENQLLRGYTLNDVLAEQHFDRDVLLVLEMGLESESLEKTLTRCCQILRTKIEKRSEVVEVIKYPLMLLVLALLTILFISGFMIPQFEKILFAMDASTKSVEIVFAVLKILPYVCIAIFIIFSILSYYMMNIGESRRLQYAFKFKPIRRLYILVYNQIFVLSIISLLSSGTHLADIIDILQNQNYNHLLAIECKSISSKMREGKSFAEALNSKYYDDKLIEVIRLGEENGLLEYYLFTYANMLVKSNNDRTKRWIMFIQPIFYLLFGGLILGMYAAIFIPMFSLMDSI